MEAWRVEELVAGVDVLVVTWKRVEGGRRRNSSERFKSELKIKNSVVHIRACTAKHFFVLFLKEKHQVK